MGDSVILRRRRMQRGDATRAITQEEMDQLPNSLGPSSRNPAMDDVPRTSLLGRLSGTG